MKVVDVRVPPAATPARKMTASPCDDGFSPVWFVKPKSTTCMAHTLHLRPLLWFQLRKDDQELLV